MTATILGHPLTGAGYFRADRIAGVGVQALFQCTRRQPQGLPPRRHFHCLKIQVGDRLSA
jgi:hypothetical protein